MLVGLNHPIVVMDAVSFDHISEFIQVRILGFEAPELSILGPI